MNIDKRLLAYKPISITLNFDWDNTTYDERVQMRHDYIEEQKKKDPNYVGYDFIDTFKVDNETKEIIYLKCFKRLINSIGQMLYINKGTVFTTLGNGESNGYNRIKININGKRKRLLIHRVVASTFIPIPTHLKDHQENLVVNHKNDVKNCNLRSNLEWCTQIENITKAYETGARKCKSYKFTVKLKGALFNKEYYFSRASDLNCVGLSERAAERSIKTKIPYFFGTWKRVSLNEIKDKRIGIDLEAIKILRDPKLGCKFNISGWVGTFCEDTPYPK
ncbi:putative HNH endonuclease [Aeromonas phage PS1]|uniref:HNH endonuclease n=1 Tax=Aeromonas phage PS1 TaxID=2591406 RepID=A0A514TV36_9CAUD|nr:HNH endonuclease [Aeromonas phage PS1]QDJ96888.1 putative HNH endonuclease [Aeromonas phage PS1]